jgi:hypothetical protein
MGRVCWKALLAAGLLALVGAAAAGQDSRGEGMTAREIDTAVWGSLADVIDHGAELYNDGDIAGCYRAFEAGLMTARPLLRHRPDLQKTIQDGLTDARETAVMWKRAWALRKLLDRVRSEINPRGGGKKGEEKEPEEKRSGDRDSEKKGTVRGTVSANGKPPAGGKITFTPPEGGASGKIGPDGRYEVSGVPAGGGTIDIELSLPGGPGKEMALAGKVTLKGKPVTGGTIQFSPEKGRAATSPIRGDGSFEVKGIPAGGKASVEIDIRPGEGKPPEKSPEEKEPDAKGGRVVSGKVTYQKKPLAGGTIVFVPAKKGTPVTATIGEDGTYEVKGVPVGECRVAVRPDEDQAKKLKALARYADPKTSGLTYEVKKEGENILDIHLD